MQLTDIKLKLKLTNTGRLKLKKLFSLMLIFYMLFQSVLWQDLTVYAASGDYDSSNYRITRINIGKTYDENRQLKTMYIDIYGSNLRNATVGIDRYAGGFQDLTGFRKINNATLLRFEASGSQLQNEANFLGQTLYIGDFSININEREIPRITQTNRKIEEGSTGADGVLTVQGTLLTNIINLPTIEAKYGKTGSASFRNLPAPLAGASDSEMKFNNITGELGLQDIVLIKTLQDTINFPNHPNTNLTTEIRHTYTSQFRLYGKLQLSGIEMIPNRGERGDTVYFRRDELNTYDVFFLREIDGTDPYTVNNRGTHKTFTVNGDGPIDILTVRVPAGLPVGEYYVVLTNPVAAGDPAEQVNQEYIMRNPDDSFARFTVIDASIKSRILSVQPNTGPDTGVRAELSGQFFGTLNIPEFRPAVSSVPSVITPVPAGESNIQQIEIRYGDGRGTYNNIPVSDAVRRITVFIGERTTFLKRADGAAFDVSFTAGLDRIAVRTPQIGDADINPIKDIIVETETIFTRAGGGSPIVIRERAELKNGFTYIPSKVKPNIVSVTPDKIQVMGTPFTVPQDRMIAINGSNFMIHRYIQDGTEIIRYPKVELGPDIVLDKNADSNIDIKVINAAGEEMDGTTGKEIGTKIIVMIPQGKTVRNLGKTYIRVTNPTRNSLDMGLDDLKLDFIEFVNPDAGNIPVINSVTPDTVAVEGGDNIVIDGSNFQDGVRVFIDGTQVLPIVRQGDGKRITFKAPKGREGETQLQVMNPQGGMDTRPFTYVKTFTNPLLTDFNPKRGNTGTLVVVKGDNFLKPEPTAPEGSVLRQIGTRIMLGSVEINEYNRDPVTQRIILQPYTSPADNPIFRIENNRLVTADYSHSVIYEAEGSSPKKYYTIDINQSGRVLLTDGAANSYEIKLNENRDAITASRIGGSVHPLTIEGDHIIIEKPTPADPFIPIRLNQQTLYRTEGGRITGNRVKVVDRGEIHFTVPVLEADGFYDLTVINPDTKRAARTGNQGFYYHTLPESRPVIDRVVPNEGSVAGGYTADVEGENFIDDGANKAKVFINGMEVAPADTTISADGRRITVVVPRYPGDLRQDKGTNRLSVPVVVLNPDGASAVKDNGFTYVIPSSRPRITRIVPAKGTAAGGDTVEIMGMDFRFFEPYNDANRNQIRDEGEEYNDLNENSRWDNLIDIQHLTPEERDELWGKTPINHSQFTHYYASPVLPKVYFGTRQARIVEFSRGYLKVISPPGQAGRTDVFVLNNDAGLSNRSPFTYESSDPRVTQIIPNSGTRLGGDRIDIHGANFARTERHIYTDAVDGSGNSVYTTDNTPLVRFGEIGNASIPREMENSGLINNNRATVNLQGNLTVEYNGTANKVTFTIKEGDTFFRKEITGYDDTVKFISTKLLRDSEGNVYGEGERDSLAEELIRFEVSDRRLLVERGYARNADYVSSQQVRAETPPYFTVGKVPVFIINPDRGRGKSDFEYKNPDSRPRIVEITKDGEASRPERIRVDGQEVDARVLKMTYKGGNIVSVFGEDFRDGVQIRISNVAAITKDRIQKSRAANEFGGSPGTLDRLTFEMPNVGEAALGIPHRVIVTNTDGGSAFSDGNIPPIYIIFIKGETNPKINKITPAEGPAGGGTRVRIEGDDFRRQIEGFEGSELKVFFGENRVASDRVTYIDYRALEVILPLSLTHGDVDVKVENPDGELAVMRNGFKYISRPNINSTDPAGIFANDTAREVTITGTMFMPGAKVVIGGEIILEKDIKQGMTVMGKGISGADSAGNNIRSAVVGGKEAASVTVKNPQTITVKFNEALDLKNSHIIVINPDGGISQPYYGFDYKIPVPDKPLVLEAIPGYESTVQLIWSKSAPEVLNAADRYEVYAKKSSDRQYTFVGDTKNAQFLLRGLQPDTRYDFMVRALNRYGSAVEFAEVTARTLSERTDHKLREKTDALVTEKEKIDWEGKEETIGTAVIKTIGREQIPDGTRPYKIDFSLAKYKDMDEFVVAIPVSVLGTINRQITVTDGKASYTFLPRTLNTREVTRVSAADRDDAAVRVILKRLSGQEAEALYSSVLRTQRRASQAYAVSFELQAGRNISQISRLLQFGILGIYFDSSAYPLANSNKLFIGRYAPAQKQFIKQSDGIRTLLWEPGQYMLLSDR